MKYYILSISDLHFSGLSEQNHAKNYIAPLSQVICSLPFDEKTHLIILVGGDVALYGKIAEFDQAKLFFEELINRIIVHFPNLQYTFALAPGNHDCDFSIYENGEEEIRKNIILPNDKLLSLYDNKDFINRKLSNYFSFRDQFRSKHLVQSHFYFDRYEFLGEGHTLNLVSFNSSISYDPLFNNNRVSVDSKMIDDNIGLHKDEINISISHYPLEWFDRNKTEYYSSIQSKANILITGHEHEYEKIYTVADGFTKCYVRLPSFQTVNQESRSGIVILDVDSCTAQLDVKHYIFDGRIYQQIEDRTMPVNITSTLMIKNSILPTDRNYFCNLFASSMSPTQNKKFINFEDAFISPICAKITLSDFDEENKTEYLTHSELSIDRFGSVTVFSGPSFFGKTVLLKKYYLDAYRLGYLPIYISFSAKNNRKGYIEEAIKKSIKSAYPNGRDFVAQNQDKVVLIIDDLHFYKDNIDDFFAYINEYSFGKIIISINPIEFNTFNVEKSSTKYFDLYRIQAFGHTQKYELVQRWVDRDGELQDGHQKDKLISEIRSLLQQVSSIDGFMNTAELTLIFLEAYNDIKPQSLMNGSKGVYYEFLFSKYILRIATLCKIEQSFIDEFLAEYAYYIFKNIDHNLSDFDTKYLEGHIIDQEEYYKNKTQLIEAMKEIDIIDKDTDSIEFKHSYIIAYFAARYYVANFSTKSDELRELIKHTDDLNASNVLLFVMYFTKNEQLVDSIVDVCNSLFLNAGEIQLNDDINFINSFICGVKDVVEYGSIRDNNKELCAFLDKKSREKGNLKKSIKVELSEAEQKIQSDFISSYKLREIIREVLNQTNTKSIVEKLIPANLSLGLRKCGDVVEYFNKYICMINSKNKKEWEEEHREYEQNILLWISLLGKVFLDHSENLAPAKFNTYVRLLLSKKDTEAYRLLNALSEFYSSRHEEEKKYYGFYRLLSEFRKEHNYFGLAMLHAVVDREVNYIGIDEKHKKELLEKAKAPTLHLQGKDYKKNLDSSRINKKTRFEFLKRLFKKQKPE